MAEVKELEFSLQGFITEGNQAPGKDTTGFGLVPTPSEPVQFANQAKRKAKQLEDALSGKLKHIRKNELADFIAALTDPNKAKQVSKGKTSIWTSFDKELYRDSTMRTSMKDLPKQVPGLFKTYKTAYGAIVENMGMRIASALDLPTSYNYIVRYTPDLHPDITSKYPPTEIKRNFNRLAIVSLDFLQSTKKIKPTISRADYTDENGNEYEIPSLDAVGGDELVHFQDVVNRIIGFNPLSGEQNLVEHWVEAVDRIIDKELSGESKEKINETKDKVHRRIAQCWLFKEFLGDCDNTDYNGGVIVNRVTKTIRYAPLFDFGDSFNKLMKTHIDPTNKKMSMEDIMKLPESARGFMLNWQEKENSESVSDIAKQFSTGEFSERNTKYILENFPKASQEFFQNIDYVMQSGKIEEIVDSYTDMTIDEKPILSKNQAEIFKEYLTCRASWFAENYVTYMATHGKEDDFSEEIHEN